MCVLPASALSSPCEASLGLATGSKCSLSMPPQPQAILPFASAAAPTSVDPPPERSSGSWCQPFPGALPLSLLLAGFLASQPSRSHLLRLPHRTPDSSTLTGSILPALNPYSVSAFFVLPGLSCLFSNKSWDGRNSQPQPAGRDALSSGGRQLEGQMYADGYANGASPGFTGGPHSKGGGGTVEGSISMRRPQPGWPTKSWPVSAP